MNEVGGNYVRIDRSGVVLRMRVVQRGEHLRASKEEDVLKIFQ